LFFYSSGTTTASNGEATSTQTSVQCGGKRKHVNIPTTVL